MSTPTTVPTGGPEELRLERRCRERSDGPAVNGVRIDELSPDNYLGALATFVSCGHSHVVHFCAAHPTVGAILLADGTEAQPLILNLSPAEVKLV